MPSDQGHALPLLLHGHLWVLRCHCLRLLLALHAVSTPTGVSDFWVGLWGMREGACVFGPIRQAPAF
jgi:hypothetical protein